MKDLSRDDSPSGTYRWSINNCRVLTLDFKYPGVFISVPSLYPFLEVNDVV